MKWLDVVTLISIILPIVKEVVRIIEELYSGTAGEIKKERAIAFLEAIWAALASGTYVKIKEIQGVPFVDVKPILEFLVDAIVAVMNKAGVFTK